MFKRASILIFFLIILVATVSANTDYNESGLGGGILINQEGQQYLLGEGIFNEQFDTNDLTTKVAILTDASKLPLVSDLNNDGVKEIIVLDQNVISLFINNASKTSLQVQPGFILSTSTTERFSNMITFDIDGDGLREIILIAELEEELHILELLPTGLVNQTPEDGIDLSSLDHTDGEFVISCFGTETCAMAFSQGGGTGFLGSPRTSKMLIAFFDSTSLGTVTDLADTSNIFQTFCMPKVRHMFAGELDGDSGIELVWTAIEVAANDEEDLKIWAVDFIASNNTFVEKWEVTDTFPRRIMDNQGSGSESFQCDGTGLETCDSNAIDNSCLAGDFVTSPLVFNADPSPTGNEVIVGIAQDEDEYAMRMYRSDGVFHDEFPEIEESEGFILSNPFRANVFPNSGTDDFCMLGFNEDPIDTAFIQSDNAIVITCGSKQGSLFLGETLQLRVDVAPFGNLTKIYDFHNSLSHAVEHKPSNIVTEVLSSYGIIEPLVNDCNIFRDCPAQFIFTMPEQDGAAIAVDYQEIPTLSTNADIIYLKQNNLFYFDNSLVDQPLSVLEFETNPCIDAVIKQNSTFQVTLIGTDPEGLGVTLSATLYADDANAQTDTVNSSSGIVTPLAPFIANQTGSGTLRMVGSDQENPDTSITIERSFTVGANGVEFGDCTSEGSTVVDVDIDEENPFNVSETALTDDGATAAVKTIADITNLSPLVLWLILMFIVAIMIVTSATGIRAAQEHPLIILVILAVVEILLLIIGTIIGAIPFGVLITIIILAIIPLGFFVRNTMQGSQSPMP